MHGALPIVQFLLSRGLIGNEAGEEYSGTVVGMHTQGLRKIRNSLKTPLCQPFVCMFSWFNVGSWYS